ncbi:hypothetical protein SERLADRAFT_411466 [Serpula lacrymans var. lacrymans S7.9]|uniref:Uncharacterized protein n=1 Tax=Serpula lacrymans var. lacrymans (strain S7.9) TaxID=578457 RepID=F8PA70_SERL9|nr:uncharacterized protein SERLADRAFT_411466 [Serpula lacrymans var. lacrymans S7.9]EGO20067.1 hypothetical protein SERLADRAFT_411466 [Serpula lacrymans var. lacrymans S7.9]
MFSLHSVLTDNTLMGIMIVVKLGPDWSIFPVVNAQMLQPGAAIVPATATSLVTVPAPHGPITLLIPLPATGAAPVQPIPPPKCTHIYYGVIFEVLESSAAGPFWLG